MEHTIDNESAHLWAEVRPDASRRMLLAAVDAFADRGYSATTTREIAERAGLSPAAVYVHYSSKVKMLHAISLIGSKAVLEAVQQALDGADAPAERVRRFVAAYVAWHARNRTLARVINYELKSLEPDQLEEVEGLRRRCERLLRTELKRGVDAGVFAIDDQRTTGTAILSLGNDVARWYAGKSPSPDALGARYAGLALRMVGSSDAF